MIERLNLGSEVGFWKGPDIKTSSSVFLEPHRLKEVPISITSYHLPPFGFSPEQLKLSTRSRLALAGLEVIGIYKNTRPQLEKETLDSGNTTGDKARAAVFNYCEIPVILNEGSSLFRFYREPKFPLEEYVLRHMLEKGKIKIEGEEGIDWKLQGGNGLFVRINTEERKWIPPDLENTPIVIDDKDPDYRGKLKELLKPVIETKKKILWIGETPKITLAEDVEAVLANDVYSKISRTVRIAPGAKQIDSRVIDGGKTDWAVRVEILSQTTPNKIPNFVRMNFFQNNPLSLT